MKKLNDLLVEKVAENPEGNFEFDGMSIEYKAHNHNLISFSVTHNNEKRIYLYNRNLEEAKEIYAKKTD